MENNDYFESQKKRYSLLATLVHIQEFHKDALKDIPVGNIEARLNDFFIKYDDLRNPEKHYKTSEENGIEEYEVPLSEFIPGVSEDIMLKIKALSKTGIVVDMYPFIKPTVKQDFNL